MAINLKPGDYSKSQISDVSADTSSLVSKKFSETLNQFPDEAIYVYSFKENKMLYANGWEPILGYKDAEISMLKLVMSTVPEYAPFVNDLNDKALQFARKQKKDYKKYSFTLELKKMHKLGHEVPLIWRVSVLNFEGDQMTEIIGRAEVNKSINLGKVMRYAAYGPEKSKFEEKLNEELFHHFAISRKEKEAISLLAKGLTYKEIAKEFNVSNSAIEKRILPLFKRFNVKSSAHLISFAYENHILP
jgi:DNA-binding CsgD family transcriptional regulator